MAYNPNSSYEPPRRAYYGQQHAPVQNGHGNRHQAQDEYYDYGYDQAGQGYEQGYAQDYGQFNPYDGPQSPQYDVRHNNDGYEDSYRDPRQQAPKQRNGDRQDRQYDPRYQQRPERGRQPNYEQLPSQNQTQQPVSSPMQQGSQYQTQQSRPNPRMGRTYPGEVQPPKQSSKQPTAGVASTTRAQYDDQHQQAPQPEKTQPSKMTMEEWKAQERARMHAESLSPESLPQDNAFPVFPTLREKSKARASGTGSMADSRSSVDAARPSTATDHQDQDRSVNGYSVQPQQRQTQEQRQSPPVVQAQRQAPPPQANASSQYGGQEGQSSYQDQTYATQEPQQQQRRKPPARGPAPQPIDTRQAVQQQKPVYFDHQPLSPAQVPPRPSTAQGARSPLKQSMTSPVSAYPRLGATNESHEMPTSHTPTRTREEEIEFEMPDFDSAAPGGTSLLHKRVQAVEKPAVELPAAATPPPMPTISPQYANASVQSLPAQKQRFYELPQDNYSERRGPMPPQRSMTDGYAVELPGDAYGQQQQYDDQYQQPRLPPPHQQQRGLPTNPRPPQAPYANEQPRGSMDDARQMPYRDGPPSQQRPHQYGQASREPYPPQQRPGVDRNLSNPMMPTPRYNSLEERVGSAPPQQQNFMGPPAAMIGGAPLTQQRSLPDQYAQQRPGNPDALPQHPVPFRPGLMAGNGQPSKPPPARHYDNAPPPTHQKKASVDRERPSRPVTAAELDQLRAAVDANPQNNKQALQYAKKLVEAATVLAPEGGRADQRTVIQNRERYIMDAHKRVKRLASAGYADAMFYLGDCYSQGTLGLAVDPKEAFKLYQAAAKAGHPQAAYRTAMCCELGPEEGGGTSKDYAKAVQWYRRGAALGDPDAMFKIGIILLKGLLGQSRNTGEAVNFLKRAADDAGSDNPRAQYELATLYESSNTNPEVRNKVVADDKYALELYQQAAKAGHRSAQHRLGMAYEYGQLGLGIDHRSSITWYTKAAAQGQHEAELALSGWYLTGAEGILKHSDAEAYLWARKAAQSEPPLAKAMFAMGYFTETGIGCPANIEEAKRWYGRAASHKFPKAQERLEELRRAGSKGAKPAYGKLSRHDQKKDEAECAVM